MTSVTRVDTVITARWLVPVVPSGTLIEHAAIAIRDGKIVALGQRETIERDFTSDTRVDLGEQHVLIPGLINCHGHAAMTLFRGLADDLPLMAWLGEHIWPAEAKFVSESFVEDGSLLAIAEMIAGGTTCFSDMYFFPEVTARVAAQHGMRAQICFPILDFPTAWASNADEYLHKGFQVRDHYRDHPLISVIPGPHAPYTVSDGPLSQVATITAQIDCGLQIHVHETAHEVAEALAKHGKRPLQRLADLGLLSPTTQLVHMTQIDDSDLALLRESGAHVVHCPESNLKLASGICPVQTLLDNGINVALGTDGAASNNDLDMFGEMRTAALIAKLTANSASALNAHQALAMATINGAKAMGLDAQIGSLEVGKLADIVAVDLSDLRCQPVYDPVSHLVYAVNSQQVTHSWIGGTLRLDNRRLTMIDTLHLRERVQAWAHSIRHQETPRQ